MTAGRTLPRWACALALAAVVLVGVAYGWHWAGQVNNWRVMTDELLYLKLAQSTAENLSLRPEFRDVAVSNYSVLYPALLAPLVGLFDPSTAFRLGHLLGAALLASTAVPTYLLASYVTRSRAVGLVAAAPMALAPWMLYSINLITEVLAGPLFAWTVYVFVRAVAEPSVRRDIVAVVVVGLLVATRTQFVFMPVLLVASVVVHELGMRLSGRAPRAWPGQVGAGLKAAVKGHLVLVAMTVATVLLLALMSSAKTAVGDYSVVLDSSQILPAGFWSGVVSRVTLVAFGVAGVPLVAMIAFVADGLWQRDDKRVHALASCVLLTAPALAFVATNFDLRFASSLLQERYLFYLAPLLLVGTACFVAVARRPVVTIAAASVVAATILSQASGLLPYGNPSLFATPARMGWVPVDGWVFRVANPVGLGSVDPTYFFAAITVAVALALAWLVRSGRRGPALIAVGCGLSVWCAALTAYSGPKLLVEHESLAIVGLAGNLDLDQRSWIDRAVGEDATVGLAPSPLASRDGKPIPREAVVEPSVWWEAEMWNRSVRRSFVYEDLRDWTPYATRPTELRRATGRLVARGSLAPYLVVANTNVRFAPAGRVVARTRDLRLIRAVRPYRAAWATAGVEGYGELVPRRKAVLSVYGNGKDRRRARVAILLAGQTAARPLTVESGGRSRAVRVFGRRRVGEDVCVPARGAGDVRLRAPGTKTLRVIAIRVTMGGPC